MGVVKTSVVFILFLLFFASQSHGQSNVDDHYPGNYLTFDDLVYIIDFGCPPAAGDCKGDILRNTKSGDSVYAVISRTCNMSDDFLANYCFDNMIIAFARKLLKYGKDHVAVNLAKNVFIPCKGEGSSCSDKRLWKLHKQYPRKKIYNSTQSKFDNKLDELFFRK